MTKEQFILMHISNHCAAYVASQHSMYTKDIRIPVFVIKDGMAYAEAIWDLLPAGIKQK